MTGRRLYGYLVRRRGVDDGGVSLAKWRRWFDGEGDSADTPPAENAGGGQSDNDWTVLPEWARQEYEGLKSQLSEVNHESAGRRHEIKQLNERLASLEQKRQEGLTLEEKLREAQAQQESLRQYEDRAKALEGIIRESNQQRINAIPEAQRSLVPAEELSPEKLATWLDKNEALLRKPVAPDLDGGAGSGGSGKTVTLTPEQKQIARRVGMTDEQYIAALKKAQGES